MSTNAIPCPKTNLAVSSTEFCQSLFNESQMQGLSNPLSPMIIKCHFPGAEQVLLDFSLAVCYRCSIQGYSLLSGSPPTVKWFPHCCVADKSELNLSKPTWDSVLVFTISLAEARLNCAFFLRHLEKTEPCPPDQECNKDSDTPVQEYPSE